MFLTGVAPLDDVALDAIKDGTAKPDMQVKIGDDALDAVTMVGPRAVKHIAALQRMYGNQVKWVAIPLSRIDDEGNIKDTI